MNTEGYRFGFNGKENDNEIKGTGNQQDYGMRIYDPRLGRFLSVDPITKNYPWLTPYQFASNTPVQAIDQDGLESSNVNTGETDNTLSGDNLKKQQEPGNKDYKPWKDLIEFKDLEAINLASSRSFWGVDSQPIEDAEGDQLNLDYYSVTISKLPSGYKSPEHFLSFVRKNFSQFKRNGGSEFHEFNKEEGRLFQTDDPYSAMMRFEVSALWGLTDLDDLSVVTTKSESNYWIFSTVETFEDGKHPVSGNRQFGITTNNNGTFTFYTRGVDRPTTLPDAILSKAIFSGAEKLWNTVMQNMANFVNSNGGSSNVNSSVVSKRISWQNEYQKK